MNASLAQLYSMTGTTYMKRYVLCSGSLFVLPSISNGCPILACDDRSCVHDEGREDGSRGPPVARCGGGPTAFGSCICVWWDAVLTCAVCLPLTMSEGRMLLTSQVELRVAFSCCSDDPHFSPDSADWHRTDCIVLAQPCVPRSTRASGIQSEQWWFLEHSIRRSLAEYAHKL